MEVQGLGNFNNTINKAIEIIDSDFYNKNRDIIREAFKERLKV